jgi:hypothetical protein
MLRHHGASAILVTEEMVAAPDACNHESRTTGGADQFTATDPADFGSRCDDDALNTNEPGLLSGKPHAIPTTVS